MKSLGRHQPRDFKKKRYHISDMHVFWKGKRGNFRVCCIAGIIIITITLQRKSQSILVYMKRCRNRPLCRHAIDVTCRVEDGALLESQQLVD